MHNSYRAVIDRRFFRLPNSRDGTAIILSGEVMAAKIRRIIATFSTQNVMNGSIVKA